MINPDDNEIILKVALSMTKGVRLPVVTRMKERGVSIEDFFTLDNNPLREALGLNPGSVFDRYDRDRALFAAREEYKFMERHSIRGLFIGDPGYPWRMADCSDAPIMLYELGDYDLNGERLLSVVGTRRLTPYGAETCRRTVKDIAGYFPDVCIVSGLAYGADAEAHTAALESGLPTVAVVAHGLNTIYPAGHRSLAKRIIENGGALISEYPSGTSAFRRNFLARNRIVAWISDATIVAESEIKGGAMSTARHAFNENREVFASPGRTIDPMSAGCNHLIRTNKASMLTSAADIIEGLDWRPLGLKPTTEMRSLFPELSGDTKIVYDLLASKAKPLAADAIFTETRIPMPRLMALLTEMEFEGILLRHPGSRYSIIAL